MLSINSEAQMGFLNWGGPSCQKYHFTTTVIRVPVLVWVLIMLIRQVRKQNGNNR